MLTMPYEWPTSQSVTPFIPISVSTCLPFKCYAVIHIWWINLSVCLCQVSREPAAWSAQPAGGGAGGSEVAA